MNVIHRIYFWRTNWWNSVWSHQWVTTHLHIQGFPDLTVAPAKKAENLTRRNSSVWLGFHFKRHELKQNFLYFLESEFIDLPEELPKVLKGHWQNLFDAQEGLITLASLKAISPRKLYYWLNDPKLLFLRTNADGRQQMEFKHVECFGNIDHVREWDFFHPHGLEWQSLKKETIFKRLWFSFSEKSFFKQLYGCIKLKEYQRIMLIHVAYFTIF